MSAPNSAARIRDWGIFGLHCLEINPVAQLLLRPFWAEVSTHYGELLNEQPRTLNYETPRSDFMTVLQLPGEFTAGRRRST